MRTLRRLALILAVALLWDWSPVLPPEPLHTAAAQVGSGVGALGSQLILQASRSSVTAANSVTADTPLWTNTLPVGVAYPMHLRLEGTITTFNNTSSGNNGVTLSCAYQSSAGILTPNASLVIVNASLANQFLNFGLSSAPLAIDFWVRPMTVWPANVVSGTGETLLGQLTVGANTTQAMTQSSYTSVAWNTLVPSNGSQSGMLDMASTTAPNIMCTWHWSSASVANSLTINNGYLMLGF